MQAYSALESAAAVKSEGVGESVARIVAVLARIVAACAMRYNQLEPTATQLPEYKYCHANQQ